MGTWKSVAGIQVSQIIPDVHRPADLHHDHQDQIQIDVVKTYRRAVVHLLDQVHRGEIAKDAIQMIRVDFARRQWIAINQGYVREYLNQIFPKMSLVKNLRKQLAQNY
jgi:hypothetical protein